MARDLKAAGAAVERAERWTEELTENPRLVAIIGAVKILP
jgi:hypothetical protein